MTSTTDAVAAAEPTDDEPAATRPRRSLRTYLVAAGLVVALGLALAMGSLWWADRSAEAARAEALDAARAMAVNLTSINGESAQEDVQRVIDGSTGGFGDLFRQNLESYTGMVRDSKVTSTGEVAAAAVVSSEQTRAEVVAAVSGEVRNATTPDAQNRQYRMKIDMVKEGDRWLVAELEFVG